VADTATPRSGRVGGARDRAGHHADRGRVARVVLHGDGGRGNRHGRVPGAAAGDHAVHLGRRDRERDDGTIDAEQSGRGVTTSGVAARVDELVHQATSATGLYAFGGDSWREGLEVLVRAAMTEATFSEFGEQSFYGSIVRA